MFPSDELWRIDEVYMLWADDGDDYDDDGDYDRYDGDKCRR